MGKTLVRIGPADHGRRMSLEEFEHAKGQEGYLYELSRGIITVSDVPNRPHLLLVGATRDQLQGYKSLHRGRIHFIASGNECKLLIPALASERHPDLAIFLCSPPPIENANLWRHWFPELVIEVVSPSSRKRDYKEKPTEYLRLYRSPLIGKSAEFRISEKRRNFGASVTFPITRIHLGAKEYRIVDPRKRVMVVMSRVRNRWVENVVEPPELYRTRLLPGLEFSCEAVFRAAGLE